MCMSRNASLYIHVCILITALHPYFESFNCKYLRDFSSDIALYFDACMGKTLTKKTKTNENKQTNKKTDNK